MGKSLIITEKPSVSRDIVAALGGFKSHEDDAYWESDGYICTYAVGHILSLMAPEDLDPKYRRWKLQDLPIIPENFDVKPVERQKQRVKIIKKLVERKDVDCLINACDAAREGELIFREIVQYLGSDKKIKRLWLQSMTKTAIADGFKTLKDGKDYEGLAHAAACRAHSDWLIGMNATRALTVRLKSRSTRGASWSAGRVQTPTLALLVQRELEILTHIPVPYWKVHADFKASDHEYQGTFFYPKFRKDDDNPDARADRIFDVKFAEKLLTDVLKQDALASESRKEKTRVAPLLFDLTTAQKEANRRFGWSAKRTLGAAQRCYEAHKVLTYPRTSSRCLPEDYREVVDKLVETFSNDSVYGPYAQKLLKQGRLNEKKVFNDAGVSDHFAIIPTGEIKDLDGDDKRFFDLVTRTFFATFYPPAIYEEIERITVCKEHSFKSKPPLVLKEAGWQFVFDKQEELSNFAPLVKGQAKADGINVTNIKIEKEEHNTKPPSRIGEAGLLSLMENAGKQVEDEELSSALKKAEGLGTAATRADIIENLKMKEYVDSQLRPTVKGIRLIDILSRINADRLTSAELTAQLEFHLNEVESGERTAESFMNEVKEITQNIVAAATDFDYDVIYPDKDELGKCPHDGNPVYERAWFYGCQEATKPADQQKQCEFLIWKDFYGRYIDRQTVSSLLNQGETAELDGFKSQSGQIYKAKLAIEDGKIVRIPVAGSEEDDPSVQGFEINSTPLGKCPIKSCPDNCQIIETAREFVCETKKKGYDAGEKYPKGFSFPRVLCKREIERDMVIAFVEKGETPFIEKFISKKGRPFSAKLVMTPTGGFTFAFPERAPRKKKGEDEDSGDEGTPKAEKVKKAAKSKKDKDVVVES